MQHPIGLFASAPVSPALGTLPNLPEQLALVASTSVQVAGRLANLLKAGRSATPQELDRCPVLLFSGHADAIPCLMDIAIGAGLDFRGKTVLLFDCFLESSDLQPLSELGAAVASLDPQSGGQPHRYVGEGNESALRLAKQWLKSNHCHLTVLQPGKKALYRAGALMAREYLAPLLAAAESCFRGAGLSPSEAAQLAERNLQLALRQWNRAGRKAWDGQLGVSDPAEVERMMLAMEEAPASVAEYFAVHGSLALSSMGSAQEWFAERAQRAGVPSLQGLPSLQGAQSRQAQHLPPQEAQLPSHPSTRSTEAAMAATAATAAATAIATSAGQPPAVLAQSGRSQSSPDQVAGQGATVDAGAVTKSKTQTEPEQGQRRPARTPPGLSKSKAAGKI